MKGILLGFILVAVAASAAQAKAPQQLYGKSIVISWTETRSSRWVGTDAPLGRNLRYGGLQIYVSSNGKVFNRLTMHTPRGEGGASDQVAGGDGGKFENRVINFSGRSLSLTTPMIGGVRNVAVDLDETFGSCTARALTGMAPGSKLIVMKSLPSGRLFEIHSIQSGDASCRVQVGNVFEGAQ